MLQWTIQPAKFELRYTWKLSRNAADVKTNLLVHVTDELVHGWGEAAPNVRYDETPEKLIRAFSGISKQQLSSCNVPGELTSVLDANDIPYALRFAIESAFFHFLAQREDKSVSELLGVPSPVPVATSYTIPVMDPGELAPFCALEKLSRFSLLKLKIDSASGIDSVIEFSRFTDSKIMVDANEAFLDVEDCIRFMEKIRKCPVILLEQPMPAAAKEESIYLKKYCPFPLFVDESITHDTDFSYLKKIADGVNVKLMKAGGYLEGIRLLREAKANKLKTMIGCMVESTLGIYGGVLLSALADYADLDSFLILQDEPFRMIREENGILQIDKHFPEMKDVPAPS